MRLVFVIVFLVLMQAKIFAQQSYFRFDRITIHEGLPSDNARKIIQDRQGIIWIGTSEGLCKYDGYHVITFTYNPVQPHSIVNNFIYDLSEDENGNIWITTAGGWCELLYNTQTFLNENDFKNFHGKLPDYNPEFILADHHHHVIMGGYSGSCILDLKDSSCKQLSFTKNNIDLPAGIASMYQDTQGLVWINFQNANLVYDPAKNKLYAPFTNTDIYPLKKNAGVLLKQDNHLWMGAWGAGLYVFDIPSQTFKTIGKDTDGIKEVVNDIEPRKLIADKNGNLWLLLVDEGIYYMDFPHKNFQLITSKTGDDNSLPSQTVRDIMCDRDGNIWIATDKGIARWNNHHRNFQTLSYTSYIPPGFVPASKNNFEIEDVLETGKELWMSVSTVGLVAMSKDSPAVCRRIQVDSGQRVSSMNRLINSLMKDNQGNIWVSTQEGYARYDKLHDCLKPFYVDRHDITVNKYCQTNMMLQDKDSIVWIASKKGLGKLDIRTNAVDWTALPVTHKTGIAFMIDKLLPQSDSILWLITHDGGIFSFNKTSHAYQRYSSENLNNRWKAFDDCNDALFISDSEMVLASQFYGLVRFNIKTKKFKIYSTVDGLPGNNICGLYADSYGALWITTTNGLARLNLKTQTFSHYDYSNGLKDLAFPNNVSFYPEPDGNVLLLDGPYILRFNPVDFAVSEKAPQVTFTSFEKYDNPVFFNRPLNEMQAIDLAYNERYFTLRFSTLKFENTTRTRYAYKMNGLDNQWHYTNTPFVSYSNLDGGSYELYVKASLDGITWSPQRKIAVSVAPPFWQTWWFYTICSAMVLAALYTFYRIRIQRLKHEMYLRTKIARDLHDDVGSTLSSLHMVSTLAAKKIADDPAKATELLSRMTESSERMTSNMQDIVWAVNPLNDSFSQIIARMQEFAAQTLELKNIELFFNAEEKMKALKLRLQYRSDLFMIFKECVNNIAKHSNAHNAWITLHRSNKHILLEVKDDGKGFDIAQCKKGNGLRNMQERARAVNGKLHVESGNTGTIITLQFTV